MLNRCASDKRLGFLDNSPRAALTYIAGCQRRHNDTDVDMEPPSRPMQNMELPSRPTQTEEESGFITHMYFHDPNMSLQSGLLFARSMIQRLLHSLTTLKRHLSRELPLLPMRREDRNREGTSKINPS
jgi:hypothetical protein